MFNKSLIGTQLGEQSDVTYQEDEVNEGEQA